MEDFPNQLMQRGEEGWHAVEAKPTEIVQVQLPAPVDTRVGLPVEFLPPEALRNFCIDQATKEFDAAMKLIKEKQYEEAEDVLTRSLAYAHWGRDTLGRTVTLMTLGQLSLQVSRPRAMPAATSTWRSMFARRFGRRVRRRRNRIPSSNTRFKTCVPRLPRRRKECH
jgi:hypothetical protein